VRRRRAYALPRVRQCAITALGCHTLCRPVEDSWCCWHKLLVYTLGRLAQCGFFRHCFGPESRSLILGSTWFATRVVAGYRLGLASETGRKTLKVPCPNKWA
jgi:hypothetical protein